MTKLTKLLPPEAAPAQTILERAHDLVMTSAEREVWPETIETAEGTVTIAVEERRPLEVGECFVDEKGEFWAVRPAVEPVLRVTGDIDLLREAAGALINRGVRVAPSEDGFMVLPLPNIAKMLGMIGLEVAEAEEAFNPIVFRQTHAGGCGCGCGGHHHHHHHGEGECGCGGHHHHHHGEGECGCGGHGHHHHHGEVECGCGCGGHEHHHHGEGECCCGGEGHHHHHGEGECGCGGHGHHHHGEGECCGGGEGHHHHHGEGECGCGGEGHHHHHGEGECCGGHGHGHGKKEGGCGCGCGGH